MEEQINHCSVCGAPYELHPGEEDDGTCSDDCLDRHHEEQENELRRLTRMGE